MIKNHIFVQIIILFLAPLWVRGQSFERLFTDDVRSDSLRHGLLALEVDNLNFFKNNEFNSTSQKGYTLPGFRLQVKTVYNALPNLRVEAGVHSIWFWGATRYPAFAYKGLPKWNGKDNSNIVHVTPLLRSHLSLSDNADIILGSLYGGANHHLIEPLYNPELNLSSDPEAGVQFLYNNSLISIDLWVDWMTFIYQNDTQGEAFTGGTSLRLKLNPSDARLHYYLLAQGVSLHQGGEINVGKSYVNTSFNAAVGGGLTYNINNVTLKKVNAEFDLAGYRTLKSGIEKFSGGSGMYAKTSVLLGNFNLTTAYWYCNNFISMFGSPFYGAVSTKIDDMLFRRPQMLYFGADYEWQPAKGFVFGFNADMFYYLSGSRYSASDGTLQASPFGNNSNIAAGIYIRI
ncbi:MAG: hypothetical protein LBD53_08000, partial [Tannerella sp.]|nr:hypothetical protein [Tannerella sp.]